MRRPSLLLSLAAGALAVRNSGALAARNSAPTALATLAASNCAMDGRPLFSPDALGRNALAYQRTLLEAGALAIRQVVSPAAPDVTYPAFLELSSSAESRTELILIITCVIIMVIAVVDAIIALIVGLISDIVQLATGPPGFLELGERFLGQHATVRLPSAQSMLEDALNTGGLGGVTGGLGGGVGGRAGGPAAAASSLLQVGEGARGKAKNRFLISVSGGCQKAIGCLGVKAMKIGFKWWIGTMQEFGDIMTGQAKMKPKKKDIENANKKPTNKDSDAMSTFLSLRDGDDDPLQLVGRSLRGLNLSAVDAAAARAALPPSAAAGAGRSGAINATALMQLNATERVAALWARLLPRRADGSLIDCRNGMPALGRCECFPGFEGDDCSLDMQVTGAILAQFGAIRAIILTASASCCSARRRARTSRTSTCASSASASASRATPAPSVSSSSARLPPPPEAPPALSFATPSPPPPPTAPTLPSSRRQPRPPPRRPSACSRRRLRWWRIRRARCRLETPPPTAPGRARR